MSGHTDTVTLRVRLRPYVRPGVAFPLEDLGRPRSDSGRALSVRVEVQP